jgi:predicted nucleic acid-binding protein
MNCVVADAGPLIALAKLELLDLPGRAFGQILVPQTVLDECREQIYSRDAVLIGEAVNNGLIEVRADVPWPVELREPRLDAGELAALAMALQTNAGLLIDEARGRREAAKLGIKVVGVCGLLLFAKREAWIAEVTPLLDRLHSSGYYISPALREHVLLQSGEA